MRVQTGLIFPKHLWVEFEALCEAQHIKPWPTLQAHAKDVVEHPEILLAGLRATIERNHQGEVEMLSKNTTWDKSDADALKELGIRLHCSRDGILRLILEGIIASGNPCDRPAKRVQYRDKLPKVALPEGWPRRPAETKADPVPEPATST